MLARWKTAQKVNAEIVWTGHKSSNNSLDTLQVSTFRQEETDLSQNGPSTSLRFRYWRADETWGGRWSGRHLHSAPARRWGYRIYAAAGFLAADVLPLSSRSSLILVDFLQFLIFYSWCKKSNDAKNFEASLI